LISEPDASVDIVHLVDLAAIAGQAALQRVLRLVTGVFHQRQRGAQRDTHRLGRRRHRIGWRQRRRGGLLALPGAQTGGVDPGLFAGEA
jgi:hypothetical protein